MPSPNAAEYAAAAQTAAFYAHALVNILLCVFTGTDYKTLGGAGWRQNGSDMLMLHAADVGE